MPNPINVVPAASRISARDITLNLAGLDGDEIRVPENRKRNMIFIHNLNLPGGAVNLLNRDRKRFMVVSPNDKIVIQTTDEVIVQNSDNATQAAVLIGETITIE